MSNWMIASVRGQGVAALTVLALPVLASPAAGQEGSGDGLAPQLQNEAGVADADEQVAAGVSSTGADEADATDEEDGHPLEWTPGGTRLRLSVGLHQEVEGTRGFAVDAYGNRFEPGAGGRGNVRFGAEFDSQLAWAPVGLGVKFEHDLVTGMEFGSTAESLLAPDLPASDDLRTELREASLRFSVTRYVHLMGGVQTSHWGLGLVANDGRQTWAPGNARFVSAVSGDRLVRGALMLGPFTDQALTIIGAVDHVGDFDGIEEDEVLSGDDALFEGDRAEQAVAALVWGFRKPTWAGAYAVLRRQTAADGAVTEVAVIDVAGAWTRSLADESTLTIAGEVAGIVGSTDLSPLVESPRSDVRQLGGGLHASWARARWGVVFDGTYASGDAAFDDGEQTAFRADRNYQMGMVFHRWVQAAWTARGQVTAADPNLVGVPAEDLERLPTRGSASNLIAVFPRAWVRPVDALEIYGGPMLAWSATDLADAFNTRIAGGDPRNALDGDPGRFLGAEFDLGIRTAHRLSGTLLSAGVEGGLLVPGSALDDAQGDGPGVLWAGRFVFDWSL